MTETTRIRWQDKTPSNRDVYNIAHIGYVGTIDEAAFIIYTPDELHADWLLSVRLTPGSQFLYADSADKLRLRLNAGWRSSSLPLARSSPTRRTTSAMTTASPWR